MVGFTLTEPAVPLAVKPVPVQLVALVLDHVSVELDPLATAVGDAENVTVGATDETVTVTLLVSLPLAFEQTTVYVVVTVGETVTVPEVPETVKLVPVHVGSFVELHVIVALDPAVIAVGVTLIVITGGSPPPPPPPSSTANETCGVSNTAAANIVMSNLFFIIPGVKFDESREIANVLNCTT